MSDESIELLKRRMTDGSLVLFTVDQVAVILGKGPRWIRDRVGAGDIPYVRVGKSVRFTEQNIRDYIEGATRPTEASTNGWGRKRRKAG